jgi:hypothetical protein
MQHGVNRSAHTPIDPPCTAEDSPDTMPILAPLLAAGLGAVSLAAASPIELYDYVVVGSGPGGGSLA